MKYSKLFGKTIKQKPAEATTASHILLHQAGFIRESSAGRYFILPLGMKVQEKVMAVIKEEMDAAGGQEMISPVLHPLSLWQETNRDKSTSYELTVVKDRRGALFALGATAEEMFVDVVRKFQLSYKDLPCNIYQFSTKFRDELRARGGLLRVREFIMKDAYSFDAGEENFKKEYRNMWQTYSRIFARLGLTTIVVESDNGYIGGDYCHEFVVESPVGETRFLTDNQGYAAHEDIATFKKETINADEERLPLKEVDAPRGTTMEDGVTFHKKPLELQIKDVLFVDGGGRFILAIIRGDLDVNETKLKHLTGSTTLRHATAEEIRDRVHSEPGFISPVKIKEKVDHDNTLVIVADDSLRTVRNAYGGANKKHRDLLNVNIDRDYTADIEGDIAMAKAGYHTKEGNVLSEKRGIEVGNIFQLGYYYSKKMRGATFMNKEGKEEEYYMGCYGIGVGRTIAAVVEMYHDDKGIIWPKQIAPFSVHLIALDAKNEEVKKRAENIYDELCRQKVEVLYDDREDVAAGVKFADADLIGIPHRLVVSKRTGDQIEYKKRSEKASRLLSLQELWKLI